MSLFSGFEPRAAIRDRSSGEVADPRPSPSPKRLHSLHPLLYKSSVCNEQIANYNSLSIPTVC